MNRMEMTYAELFELAIEALSRTGMLNEPGHPEDLAAHLGPALESVAVGYGEGYKRGLAEARSQWFDRVRGA